MAHFALINKENIVKNVIVVSNKNVGEGNLAATENTGRRFLAKLNIPMEPGDRWLQTSYNNNFRGQFAGIGMKYDPEQDIFFSEETT